MVTFSICQRPCPFVANLVTVILSLSVLILPVCNLDLHSQEEEALAASGPGPGGARAAGGGSSTEGGGAGGSKEEDGEEPARSQ